MSDTSRQFDEFIRIYPCEVVGEMLEAKPSDEETEKPDTIEFDEVTPDVIVTCGRCGHHIRVGRKQ